MAGPYYTTIDGETAGESTSKESNPELGNRIVRGLHTLGDIAYIERKYTLLGTEAATEKIRICRNYPELNLLPDLSSVFAQNPGTALILDIGDDADPDKYADGLDISAGGFFNFTDSGTDPVQLLTPVITSDDADDGQGDWIYATVDTATSLTADQEIRIRLYFAVNS